MVLCLEMPGDKRGKSGDEYANGLPVERVRDVVSNLAHGEVVNASI